MKKVLFFLLFFTGLAAGQGADHIAVTNNDGGNKNFVGYDNGTAGANNAFLQMGVSVVTPPDFGGAPITNLSGISAAVTNATAIDCSGALEATPTAVQGSAVAIRVEGQSPTDSVDIIVWLSDHNATAAWTPSAKQTIVTDKQADATSFPSVGTDLSCTTNCYVGTLAYVPTLGAETCHVEVTAVTGTVSVWGALVAGVVN